MNFTSATKLVISFSLSWAVTVHALCQFAETSVSGFGNIGTPVETKQIGTLTVICDSEYRLGIDTGMQPSGWRRLSDGHGHFIAYHLWQDSGGLQEWGDRDLTVTTYPAPSLTRTGNGSPTIHLLFGSLLSKGTLVGQYTDTVQVLLAYPPYGPAEQQTVRLLLSTQITGSCTIEAGGITGFGNYPTGSADLTGVALGAFSVTCPTGLHYGLGIDAGQYFDGRHRRMSDGNHFIPYTLWTHQTSRQEWGDRGLNAIEPTYVETYPASALFGEGSGGPQAIFLWGDAALKSSGAPMGVYLDNVGVTIAW